MDSFSKRQDGHSILMNKAHSNSVSKVILTKSESVESTPSTPHTPTDGPQTHGSVSSSPSGSMSPDQGVQDLSQDLIVAGWRKFWSNREKRPYFFNKITNESLWETPIIGVNTGIIRVNIIVFSSYIVFILKILSVNLCH